MADRPRLLLLDENASDRVLAAAVLTRAFPDAEIVEIDGAEVLLPALQSRPVDVVVTPLGLEAARWDFLLQAIWAAQPSVPVIVFDAARDDEIAAEVRAAGATAYLLKSSQGFLDLADVVARALPGRRSPVEASGPASL